MPKSRARKTVWISDLIDWVNEQNRTSTCSPDVRRGWNTLATHCLKEVKAYKGFVCLSGEDETRLRFLLSSTHKVNE